MEHGKLPIDMLIFDFDGTLADSLPLAIEAMREMLKKLGYPIKSKEEISQYIGYGERPFVSGSIGREDEDLIMKARQAYFEIYAEKLKGISLYPHIKETLIFFKSKIKVIISNKRQKFIKMILDRHQAADQFAEILGEENSFCLKPDPCMILELIKKYKIAPGKTLLVGDMTIDIQTGKNAGVHTCAVTYGFDSREKLAGAKPDIMIDDILQLKERIT